MARIIVESDARKATEEQYRRLETGDILFFEQTPFALTADERAFLLSQKQVSASYHKNISYRPAQDRIRAVDNTDPQALERMHKVMRLYSERVIGFVESFLPRYAKGWTIDFASFRPVEEGGRQLAVRSRNDLIHIDNLPSRPSHGDRILRIFTNIHPMRPRIWVTSDSFEPLAWRYASKAGLPRRQTKLNELGGRMLGLLNQMGVPVVHRPPYDRFMRRFHNYMKENEDFQRECPKERWEFPPDSTWIAFTDTTSHSCVSGQYALEQTFIVRKESLAWPEKAPIAVLEQIAGFPLAKSRARSA